MRDKLNVLDHISAMIYNNDPTITPEMSKSIVDEYVLIKRILSECSITVGNSSILYTEVMTNIMRELKQSDRLTSNIKAFSITNSNSKNNKVAPAVKDKNHNYLTRFFYVDLKLLGQILREIKKKPLDFDDAKEALLQVILDNKHVFNPNISELAARRISANVSSASRVSFIELNPIV